LLVNITAAGVGVPDGVADGCAWDDPGVGGAELLPGEEAEAPLQAASIDAATAITAARATDVLARMAILMWSALPRNQSRLRIY
jgi:hypothetical protein